MGLDGVELIMALEEAFGVELKDEEVFKAVTPRLIGDIIFSKLRATDERVCQSQRSFYVLRRALMRQFGLGRGEVTLDRKLREFIPCERERELWPLLKDAVQARCWPQLVRPQRLVRACQAVGVALFAACVYLTAASGCGWFLGCLCGCVALILFGCLAARWTAKFRCRIPPRYCRVRDLVPLAMASDCVAWTREQVSARVKEIVQEQLGISDEKYTEDSHFINDFAMD